MDVTRLATALADRYHVERELGAGGMATVFLAHDLKHEREVALKVLRPDLAAVLGAERFLAEIKITAGLDHPHILTLIDSGVADGFLYYVLPYVRGESLRAKLEREKQLGIEESLAIARQVASALDYAHRQGVVHRDVKPENILLQEGEAILTDFGIALAVKEAGGRRLTETGLSLGTPQYMSPEQATGDRELDARSDVYSLGAVLFEMLSGVPPVTGPTVQAMIAKLITERPVRLRSLRDTVPEGIDNAVARALSRVPADRHSSAAGFAAALEAGSAAGREPRARQRRWPLVAALALLVVAVAVAGTVAGRQLLGRRHAPVALRDRTQLTSTGNVRRPAISADGRQIAFVVTECDARRCTSAVDLQDVGGTTRRRVVEGATSIYRIEWSADRRTLLFNGSYGGAFGGFLVSALGGEPRHVSAHPASFSADGDSLIIVRFAASPEKWVRIASLDGVVRDSFLVDIPGARIWSVWDVPGSPWFIAVVAHGSHTDIVSVDRRGRTGDRFSVARLAAMARTTDDALWYAPGLVNRLPRIIRVPFDADGGRFGADHDTVYTGSTWGFDVTADGGTLVLDEGSTDFGVWALPLADALHGSLPPDRRLLTSSAEFSATISPDGRRLLVGRGNVRSPETADAPSYSFMPFDGGPETPLPLVNPGTVYWADSTTLAVWERPDGDRLSLMDVRTLRRREVLDLPDTAIWGFAALPGGGWAWLTPQGAGFRVLARGDTRPRDYPKPAWDLSLHDLHATRDGAGVLIAGFDAETFDSLRVERIALADGAAVPWATDYAEYGWVNPLADGTFLLVRRGDQESVTLEHLLGPGRVDTLGTIPRPVTSFSASADLRRAVLTSYDYRGDIYMSRVVRP